MEKIDLIRRKLKEQEENLISIKLLAEQELNDFDKRLKKLPNEIKEEIGDYDLNTQTVFPSLYKDEINVEEFNKELEEFNKFCKKIDDIRERLIKEINI